MTNATSFPAIPLPPLVAGEKMVAIRGRTYSVRAELKAPGGRWNGTDWTVPASRAVIAQDVVSAI